MRKGFGACLAGGLLMAVPPVLLPAEAAGDAVGPLVARIKAVGPEGAGNAEAAAAWRTLSRLGPEVLPEVLAAMDDADPVAANWLRAAVDAIAERALAAGRPLPARRLEAFVRRTDHAGPARRLAYEWLVRVDPSAPDRLLPGMLHDPGAELRRDAVERVIRAAREHLDRGDRRAATDAYRKALSAALDPDQVERIAQDLKPLGVKVDLAPHFGFLRRWLLLGPFDNRGGAGFATVFPPEKGIDLTFTFRGKDGVRLRWRECTTDDPHGMVDLNKALGPHKGAVAYALTVVDSPAARPVQLRAGSDNAVKMFLNGRLLLAREEYHHGIHMDQHVARGDLRAGRNEILLKVCQDEQTEEWNRRWSFQLRVTDPSGDKIPLTDAIGRMP
jgi:hypothetical protein